MLGWIHVLRSRVCKVRCLRKFGASSSPKRIAAQESAHGWSRRRKNGRMKKNARGFASAQMSRGPKLMHSTESSGTQRRKPRMCLIKLLQQPEQNFDHTHYLEYCPNLNGYVRGLRNVVLNEHSYIIVILRSAATNAEGISRRDRFATFGRIHDTTASSIYKASLP